MIYRHVDTGMLSRIVIPRIWSVDLNGWCVVALEVETGRMFTQYETDYYKKRELETEEPDASYQRRENFEDLEIMEDDEYDNTDEQ